MSDFSGTVYDEGYDKGYKKGISDMYNAYKNVERKIAEEEYEARRQTRIIFCESGPELESLLQKITWRICGITPDARYTLRVRQNSITCGPKTLEFRINTQSAHWGVDYKYVIKEEDAIDWLMEVNE